MKPAVAQGPAKELGATLIEGALACALAALCLFSIGTSLTSSIDNSLHRTGAALSGNAAAVGDGSGVAAKAPPSRNYTN